MAGGLTLGVILALSIIVSFMHWPGFLRRFFLKHFIISDILVSVFTYVILSAVSTSLTAVAAAIVTGFIINMALVIYRKLEKYRAKQ
jgi:hypothetical protein